jgi:acylphosphatase
MNPPPGQALRVVVRGRVQGVGYRAWTVRQARRLGLSGWVRNREDGSVELLAAGPEAALGALLQACRSGPSLARVDGIETHPAEPPAQLGFVQAATV